MRQQPALSVLAIWWLIAALTGGTVLAQTDIGASPEATYSLERAVVGAGGVNAAGAGFTLEATGGQPAAGLASGVGLTLEVGFWPVRPQGSSEPRIWLPLIWYAHP